MDTRIPSFAGIVALVFTLLSRPAAAHVDYVTEGPGDALDALEFALSVLSNPVNAAIFGVSGLAVTAGLAAYLWVRPTIADIVILRDVLIGYSDLVPWMLRLSVGLPLVGAGFQGYLFAPTVTFDPATNPLARILFIGMGFTLLFGLATRIVTTIGLATFGWALSVDPGVVLAMEYVPAFLALLILGGGRPSADHMLQQVASTDGTYYGRVDPVHHLKRFLDATTDQFREYVPVIVRVGMGVTFIYLGLIQKLAEPGQALLVVEKYDLTAVVPVDPGMWVLGAGLTEMLVGLVLIVGFMTRGAAAVSFVLFTTTLFGLPDDPVLAHITLFGMASAVFTMGAGPLSFDNWFGRPAQSDRETSVSAD
ncbi:DoxX family protein [Haloarcula sp. CBA1130]|uniref:DoxX family protein n=1 Tax=unclassified Haloarcula TaxID=2624677 RepID=UPI00124525A3|nr:MULTISPECIES: DoxX family membrane protein [unclassified Haloarcula]KAA9396956.1 DoxX family protein [Haloarcula sp. CBA1129]KAA9403006.1 DoxX family protein [Haloarcula sp. CBA1130]